MNILKMLIFTTGLMSIPMAAHADFKSEIINSCKAYQQGKDKSEVNACKLYIDGFIDSSLLTEDAALKSQSMIENARPEQSDFVKRAYQTRVLTTSSVLANEESHQFCIPAEYDRRKIASTVAKSLDIQQLDSKPLKEVLFETLIIGFPCH
jgi:hypothetical protein